MLASLDDLPGIAESRVDWTGRLILLSLDAGADPGEVVVRANEALGGDAKRLDRAAESRAISSFRSGDSTWMRTGETLRLSKSEAKILAERFGAGAAERAGLYGELARMLQAVLEEEIAAAFERIHAEGKGIPPDLSARFHRTAENTLELSRSFLSAEQIRRVEEYFAEVAAPPAR